MASHAGAAVTDHGMPDPSNFTASNTKNATMAVAMAQVYTYADVLVPTATNVYCQHPTAWCSHSLPHTEFTAPLARRTRQASAPVTPNKPKRTHSGANVAPYDHDRDPVARINENKVAKNTHTHGAMRTSTSLSGVRQ